MARSTVLSALLILVLAGCGGPRVCLNGCPGQSAACKSYVDCFARTGGDATSLDSTYGPNGTCWTINQAAAASCTEACASAVKSLQAAFPAAGCKQ